MKNKFIWVVLLVATSSTSCALCQVDSGLALLDKLQHAGSTEATYTALLVAAQKSSELRAEVLRRLPSLLASAANTEAIANDSRLAGDLKCELCIPEVTRVYLHGDARGGAITLSMITHLRNDPAGTALVELGDASIPSLRPFLRSEDDEVRLKVLRVLANIGSPQALDLMRERQPEEHNPQLLRLIQTHTNPNLQK